MPVINRNSAAPIYDTLADAIASNMRVGQQCIVQNNTGSDDVTTNYKVVANGSGGIAMNNGNELLGFGYDKVDSISQLPPATGSGRKVSVTGYYDDTTVGGGPMVDAGPARHNGVTLFDPNRAGEIGTSAYYVDSGVDANCWGRIRNGALTAYDAGAVFGYATDSYNALQALYSSAKRIKINGEFFSSQGLTGQSRQTIDGYGDVIKFANDINCMTFTNQSRSKVLGLEIIVDDVSTVNGHGILFSNSSNCEVSGCTFTGLSNNGVYATGGSSKIRVESCVFSGFQGDIQDSSDIAFYNGAYECVASKNDCRGGNWHGIRCQLNSINHRVTDNYVGQHRAYGILAGYEQVDIESGTYVGGNVVEDILGDVLIDGDLRAGAGIYFQSAYGIKVVGNTVRRANQQTVTEVLAPGAIGGSGRCVIQGNVIEDTYWYGIANFSEDESCVISGNIIKDSLKTAIYCKNGINATITGNNIEFTTTPQRGIFVRHQSARYRNVNISGNTVINGSESYGLENVDWFTITGNNGKDATSRILNCNNVNDGTITGNNFKNAASDTLRVATATNVQVNGNYLSSAGTFSIVTAGAVSNCEAKNNTLSPAVVAVSNGFIVEITAGAAPVSGTWSQGSSAINSSPVAAGFYGWSCVAAGSPGTWKTFGAISA